MRLRWQSSLQFRLVTSFVLLSWSSVAVVGYLAYVRARAELTHSVLSRLDAAAGAKADALRHWIQDQHAGVRQLGSLPELREHTLAVVGAGTPRSAVAGRHYDLLAEILGSAAAQNTNLLEVFVLSASGGRVVCSTDRSHEAEYHLRDAYFVKGLQGPFVQGVYASPTTQRPTVTLVTPLEDPRGGRRIGVLAAHLSLERMDEVLRAEPRLGGTAEVYLVDRLNLFVSARRFGRDRFPRGVHSAGIDAGIQGTNGVGQYANYDGIVVLGAHRWIADLGAVIVAEVQVTEALAPARNLAGTITLLGLGSAAILALGVSLIGRRLVRQIATITEVATRAAAGDLKHRAPATRRDEIGMLGRTFNTMAENLSRAEEDRKDHLWFLESLDQVNRAIQRTHDLDEMMGGVLDALMAIFDCDRAWLVHPCDPGASRWQVPMQRTRPEFLGLPQGVDLPLDPVGASVYRVLRDAGRPVQFGPGCAHQVPLEMAQRFGVRSFVATALYPKVGQPWAYGLHQCSHDRVWTPNEEQLVQEIGRRISDGLTGLLAFRSLHESEDKLEAAERVARVGYWEYDIGADRISWSEETRRICGLPPEERLLNRARMLELIHPDDRRRVDQAIEDAIQSVSRYATEYRVVLPGGEVRYVHSQGDVLLDRGTRPERVFGTVQDVTEQRLAAAELRASEERYRAIFQNSPLGIFRSTFEGRFLEVNTALARMLGYDTPEATVTEVLDIGAQTYADPDDRRRILNEHLDAIDATQRVNRYRRRDGSEFSANLYLKTIRDAEGRPLFLEGIVEDVTERKKLEEQMRRTAAAVEQAGEAVIITDPSAVIEYVNPAFTRLTGFSREEAVGQNPRILNSGKHPRGFFREMWDTLVRGSVWHGHLINKRKDGSLFEEDATISPVRDENGQLAHYVAVKRDITQEVALEGQLRQVQKMEAVGRLAGGIAHDFNNVLFAIEGYGGIVYRKMASNDPLRANVQHILEATERAAQLTRGLLAFSRKQAMTLKPIRPNEVVARMEGFLRRIIGEDIELKTILGEDATVLADVGQIEQVVMNLATNARDAMPRGGCLTLETGLLETTNELVQVQGLEHPGRYVVVSVVDSGVGMDEQTLKSVFEPFFTTKEVGRGTGLGMAIVYGIVRQHHGHVAVSSEVGSGTTVRVYLPARTVADERARPSEPELPLIGGRETLLLAEDDPSVRGLLEKLLKEFGYHVITARDGQDAVAKFVANEARVDLCILDVIMPKKSGREACEEIRRRKPQAKVVFASGYSEERVREEGLPQGCAFLQKPAPPQVILRTIRDVLDGRFDDAR